VSLFAMMSFGDDDPDLHVHFSRHARVLEESDPAEFARMLRVLEEACAEYVARLYRVRRAIEDALPTAAPAVPDQDDDPHAEFHRTGI
jgi:hypothetical protein